MSVHVRIEYRQPDPEDGGKEKAITYRELEIRRVVAEGNNPERSALDGIYDYEVIDERRGRRETFKHRFGDDLAVLVGKAVEAIRDAFGVL